MHNRSRRSGRFAPAGWRAVALLCAAAAALLGCRTRQRAGGVPPPPAGAAPSQAASGPVKIVYSPRPSLVELIAQAAPSVVSIRTSRQVKGGPASLFPGVELGHGLGSGFVIDTHGYVLTTEHVLGQAGEVSVVMNDGERREIPAQIVGRDPTLDLGLLKIEPSQVPPAALKPLARGNSAELAVGEWVVALGNPFGTEVTAHVGILSARGISDDTGIAGRRGDFSTLLRTDAAIHAGNSGGPLINLNGEVIGLNRATDSRGTGVGFAIPMDRIEPLLPQLKSEGVITRAWLGVFVRPVEPEVAAQRGVEAGTGALVVEVVPGSPAARGGVRPGDIIVHFAGRRVDHRNLPWLAASAGIHRTVAVTVWRDKSKTDLQLYTEPMPE